MGEFGELAPSPAWDLWEVGAGLLGKGSEFVYPGVVEKRGVCMGGTLG